MAFKHQSQRRQTPDNLAIPLFGHQPVQIRRRVGQIGDRNRNSHETPPSYKPTGDTESQLTEPRESPTSQKIRRVVLAIIVSHSGGASPIACPCPTPRGSCVMTNAENIVVLYTSVDGCRIKRAFKRTGWARKFAQKWVGPCPEIGRSYAISDDGVDKIEVWGT